MNKRTVQKLLILLLAAAVAASAAVSFLGLRRGYDKIVLSSAVTSVRYLSDYESTLSKTEADAPVFFCDSGREGATVLILGGTHGAEVGGILSCYLLLENLKIEEGRAIIIPVANMSAQGATLPGFGFPDYYSIDTSWGKAVFRIGNRATSPIDQWPDPFICIQYPSGQQLSYEEARNLNRAYPGRDGSLTERIAKAVMNLIEKENVDLAFDLHEASITYPVNDTIVTTEEGYDIAYLASLMMSEKGQTMASEQAAPSLKGYSHSEWGKTGPLSFLIEVPTPLIDRTPGVMLPSLAVNGNDPFLKKLADKGFAGLSMSDDGYPIEVRTGLHLSALKGVIDIWSDMYSGLPFTATWPFYEDLEKNGVGAYLTNPETSNRAFIVSPK